MPQQSTAGGESIWDTMPRGIDGGARTGDGDQHVTKQKSSSGGSPARRPTASRRRLFSKRVDLPLGAGLVATVPIRKRTIVHRWAPSDVLPHPTYMSVQIGRRSHAHDAEFLDLLNHSCEPNLKIDISRKAFVAVRDISPGEILTYFYPSTEWDMARPFRCRCGSPGCIGIMRGARHLSRAALAGHPLSRHIRELLRAPAAASGRRARRG